MEGLDTRLMTASSVNLNYPHQVLKERLISSAPFMEINQMSHQESGTANLQNITSTTGSLLPKPFMWFQLSWGDLIITPFIMVMLRFTLHSFQFNLTLNMFQIQTNLQSNQLMMIKCTISLSSLTQNMMVIF